MANGTPSRPSFSPRRKWSIGFNVTLAVVTVLAIAVMVNYLGASFSHRFYLSTNTRIELSPRTISLLRSLTNHIRITLYYDRDDPLYGDITDLLKEYQSYDSRIAVQTVDYTRDAATAEQIKTKYKLDASTDKNLVIFDCNGRTKIVPGKMLADTRYESVLKGTNYTFIPKLVAFQGEMMFTGALLAVSSDKPFMAYFLQGDGEHRPDDTDPVMGYTKFVSRLRQNYIQVEALSLLGTNTVPDDCGLLIIAGPIRPLPPIELERIDQYLNEGGRLFALFDFRSVAVETGLEKILAKWAVEVSNGIVKDPKLTSNGSDVVVETFAQHPAVRALIGSALQLILPREIKRMDLPAQSADKPDVEEIAFSGPGSYLSNGGPSQKPRALPLMVAVQGASAKRRGTTRILVVGDSIFVGNRQIESAANGDFVGYAANWLLDRTVLLKGLSPKPVTEYRLLMTQRQMQATEWMLLGALPGGVLLFGGLVWFVRRR